MKTYPKSFKKIFVVVSAVVFLVFVTSFDNQPFDESNYTAVLMTRAELEKSISFEPAIPIKDIGKIYKKDNWVYITEKYKGIHIIDNTNPAIPVNAGFIKVPGCIDIAMKNQYLYADNSVDLVTIDMSAIPEIKITDRQRDIFPEPLPPDLQYIPYKFSPASRPGNTIIVEWKKIH